jgi:hypothetical protein
MPDRPQKITFAEMRDMGVRGMVIYWLRTHQTNIDRYESRVILSGSLCRSAFPKSA